MPAAIQLRKWDKTTAPDPANVIVVNDDEPLSSSDKPKGSAKKAPTYTTAKEATRQECRDCMHSDCWQLQYENEFESFNEYRKTIKNLRLAPNTDDHTAYLHEKVLKEQTQSYS